jgi:hypothetical protein
VDRTDADLLLANLGTLSGATTAMGDADADTDVDGNDLAELLLGYGANALDVPAGSTAALAGGGPSVPEPATGILAVLGALALSTRKLCKSLQIDASSARGAGKCISQMLHSITNCNIRRLDDARQW